MEEPMAKAVRSLSPKQIAERTQLHRQAVIQLARLAAKNAVKEEMRAQGIRLTLVFPAVITAKANEYLSAHRELFDEARERAKRLGYVDPLADIKTNTRTTNTQSIGTSAVQNSCTEWRDK
jgi:Na+-transporting NADH:ubiquinone oxidoreductase subunit NqrC